MADEDSSGAQVTATVTVALSGNPAKGLRIITDGSTRDVAADWTKEYEVAVFDDPAVGNPGTRVVVTDRSPARPIVTGAAVQGRS